MVARGRTGVVESGRRRVHVVRRRPRAVAIEGAHAGVHRQQRGAGMVLHGRDLTGCRAGVREDPASQLTEQVGIDRPGRSDGPDAGGVAVTGR